MGTVNQLLDLAREQIGTTSGKKYWSYFRGNTYVNGDVTPYCAYFDSWLLDVTKTPCPYFPNGYAFDEYDNLGGRGVKKYDLQPGDMVAFDWDSPPDYRGDHVGVVESVWDWGCVCIEGNTSGGIVARRQRVWDVIICGLRPYYENDTSTGTWIPESDGRWWYQLKDNTYPVSKWLKIEGKWYYFDDDGWLVSGWVGHDDEWYYCHEEHDGHFGEMEHSKVIVWKGDYYILGKDGKMYTGPNTNPNHDGSFGKILF